MITVQIDYDTLRALHRVLIYLDDARKDYESRPRAGHIYESVRTFTKWFDSGLSCMATSSANKDYGLRKLCERF